MTNYIGITIGPIHDTLSLSASPAALWAGSFLFSYLSRMLCEKISQKTGNEADIVSPYFDSQDQGLNMKDGVGRFHDRIIVRAERITIKEIPEIIAETKKELADILSQNIQKSFDGKNSKNRCPTAPEIGNWLAAYLQVRAVAYEVKENIILDGSVFLDAIECERIFSPLETRNYLLDLFEYGKDDQERENRNKAVKDLARDGFKVDPNKWQLLDPSDADKNKASILELEEIAGKKWYREKLPDKKKFLYYAVIQSDGDNMSELIKKCGTDSDKLRHYSQKLLKFSRAAAAATDRYGGVTIYAGGDDLLCLAPVENQEGETVLNLLEDIRRIFASEDFFGENADSPTLSFGVAIRYYKHPLYEAFADAGRLLVDQAKEKGGKNAAAISLRKHSGRDAEFVLKKFSNNPCLALIQQLITGHCADEYLNSVLFHMHDFQALFRQALADAKNQNNPDAPMLKNVFANIFDHEIHEEGGTPAQLDAVRRLYFHSKNNVLPLDSRRIAVNQAERDEAALDAVLRLARFFNEEGQEDA
ncbi:MAG: type III-B CRISPR-associated protein Cas10/Cmr2 [Desulfobulbaceae bacterium]|jgi:CRISPR-associated protein Cmr2|nr:type III-B CRISPR-associated protein Cas10/Cmr2 [Desulfobulbaceae bacterium]